MRHETIIKGRYYGETNNVNLHRRNEKKQDELQFNNSGDLSVIKGLHMDIIDEAYTNGFSGTVNTYDALGEIATDLYYSEEDLDDDFDGDDVDQYGFYNSCQEPIEGLESFITEQ